VCVPDTSQRFLFQIRGGGELRRVKDKDNFYSIQMYGGTSPRDTFITAPRKPFPTLGIKLKWITFVLMTMRRFLTIQIQVKDELGIRRKFVLTNTHCEKIEGNDYVAHLPIDFETPFEFNQIQLNLEFLTERVFGVRYEETTRVQIYAGCRLRMVNDQRQGNIKLPDPEIRISSFLISFQIYFSALPLEIDEVTVTMGGILEKIAEDIEYDPKDSRRKTYLLVPMPYHYQVEPAYVLALQHKLVPRRRTPAEPEKPDMPKSSNRVRLTPGRAKTAVILPTASNLDPATGINSRPVTATIGNESYVLPPPPQRKYEPDEEFFCSMQKNVKFLSPQTGS